MKCCGLGFGFVFFVVVIVAPPVCRASVQDRLLDSATSAEAAADYVGAVSFLERALLAGGPRTAEAEQRLNDYYQLLGMESQVVTPATDVPLQPSSPWSISAELSLGRTRYVEGPKEDRYTERSTTTGASVEIGYAHRVAGLDAQLDAGISMDGYLQREASDDADTSAAADTSSKSRTWSGTLGWSLYGGDWSLTLGGEVNRPDDDPVNYGVNANVMETLMRSGPHRFWISGSGYWNSRYRDLAGLRGGWSLSSAGGWKMGAAASLGAAFADPERDTIGVWSDSVWNPYSAPGGEMEFPWMNLVQSEGSAGLQLRVGWSDPDSTGLDIGLGGGAQYILALDKDGWYSPTLNGEALASWDELRQDADNGNYYIQVTVYDTAQLTELGLPARVDVVYRTYLLDNPDQAADGIPVVATTPVGFELWETRKQAVQYSGWAELGWRFSHGVSCALRYDGSLRSYLSLPDDHPEHYRNQNTSSTIRLLLRASV